MKNLVVIALFIVFAAVVWARPAAKDGEHYTDEFDNVDVDEILKNSRIFDSYHNCLKTGKKCTPAGLKLRELLPDALKTKCAKCTEIQKTKSRQVLDFVLKNKPEKFKELEDIFDKEQVYRKAYAEDLKKEGFVLPN